MTDDNPGPGDQHDAKDAHVQVLTAEVRTLVAGSRQVTMSIYNQLDEVRYCHIEPFGRVAPRNALDGWVYMVGKDKAADVRVRSSLHASRAARCHGRGVFRAWCPAGYDLPSSQGGGMNEAVIEQVGWYIRGGIDQDLRRLLRVAGLTAGPT